MQSKIEKLIAEARGRTEIAVVTLSVAESVVFKFAKNHYDKQKAFKSQTPVCDATVLRSLLASVYRREIAVIDLYAIVSQVYNDWVMDTDKCKFIKDLFIRDMKLAGSVNVTTVIDKMLSYIGLITMIDLEYEINFNEIDPCSQFLNFN